MTTLFLPEEIKAYIGTRTSTIDTFGLSGSTVFLYDDMVLKRSPQNEESENELTMLRLLADRLPVPRLLAHTLADGHSYLLMSRLSGKMACDHDYLSRPETLTRLLAEGLQLLWDNTPDAPAPYPKQGLAQKLAYARTRIARGLVRTDNAEADTYGSNGFSSPSALLAWLETHQPEEIPVLSHGDFCLPNLFLENDSISGFLDFSRSGLADKWQDIALCYRSLSHNQNGRYGGACYDGSPDLLFSYLGLEKDEERLRYYILLDELF